MADDRPTVLVVHHSPMGSVQRLTDAVASGVEHPALEGAVAVRLVAALEATAEDVLASDAVICVTPVNFGYMSGALKHFFDRSFRQLEDTTSGLPYVAVIKGTTDATGAVRAVEAIATGMQWKAVAPPLAIEGEVTDEVADQAEELAATLAASLLM